jgi:hypothetical protein
MSQTPRVTAQLHLRITPAEKQALSEEARAHGISMSALIRLSVITAREVREREALKRQLYPQRCVDDL